MSHLLEDLDEHDVLTLTLNRPDRRNTMTEALSDDLYRAVSKAAENHEVRCLVLTGAGKTFCAGGDMEVMDGFSPEGGEERSQEELIAMLREGMKLVELLHEMPKPTLAVINGAAAGAGLMFALACDMRFCLDTAKLTTAFSMIGTSGDSGISYFLPRIVGPAKAAELMFSSEVITGAQAHEIGLVTKVASAEEFEAASRAFAKHLANLPTLAIGLMKRNLAASSSSTLSEILDLEADSMVRSMDTEDHRNAVQAFINKQQPKFEGR